MPFLGNNVDAIFIPESVNTSTTLKINGGDLNVNNGQFFADQSTTNVGIGTTQPQHLLDIWGDGAHTAQLTLRQWNDNSITDDGGIVDGPDMRFIASGGTIASPAEMDDDDVIGKVNAFAYNGISSSQYGGFGWRYYRDATDPLDIKRGSTFVIETKSIGESSNSEKLSIDEEGNVSISSGSTYQIAGTQISTADVTENASYLYYTDARARSAISAGTGVSITDGQIAIGQAVATTDSVSFAGGTFSGNVGVGTASAPQKLSIYADTGAGAYGTQILLQQDGEGDVGIQFNLVDEANWTIGVDNSESNKFKIEAGNAIGGSNDFVIQSDGNVGIGTTNPGAKLDVNGDIYIADKIATRQSPNNSFLDFDDDIDPLNQGNNNFVTLASISGLNLIFDTNDNDENRFVVGSGSADTNAAIKHMVITHVGNVGIGSTNPDGLLHIYGQSTPAGGASEEIHADFILENTGLGNARFFLKTVANNRNWEFFADDSDGAFGIYDGVGTARRFTILPSGNVGIATAAPAETLHVEGTALITGQLKTSLDYPTILPSLRLIFTSSTKLDSRITFTRPSAATYIGPDGYVKTAAYDEPRFDHDPITKENLGLLIEESRQNILPYSFWIVDNTQWLRAGVITESTTDVKSPDGEYNAVALRDDGTNGQHTLYDDVSISDITTTYTASCWVKAGTRNYAELFSNGAGGAGTITIGYKYDLVNKTTTYTGATGFDTGTSATITEYSNGWLRITMTGDIADTATGAGTYRFHVRARSDISGNYQGDGGIGIYIWGPQLEAGPFATSYIPTSGSQVTRSQDNAYLLNDNFTTWFNPEEGTMFASYSKYYNEFRSSPFNHYPTVFAIGSWPYRINLADFGGTTGQQGTVADNAVFQFQEILNGGSLTPINTELSFSMAYKANDFAAIGYDQTLYTDTSGIIPDILTQKPYATIGSEYGSSGATLNGHIKKVVYYPQRITDNQLVNNTL